MKTKTCPYCEKEINTDLKICNFCNKKINYGIFSIPKIDKYTYILFGTLSLVLFIYSIGYFLMYQNNDSIKGLIGIFGIVIFGTLFIYFSIKRIRDIGRNTKLVLLFLIPIINTIFFCVLLVKGSKKSNIK